MKGAEGRARFPALAFSLFVLYLWFSSLVATPSLLAKPSHGRFGHFLFFRFLHSCSLALPCLFLKLSFSVVLCADTGDANNPFERSMKISGQGGTVKAGTPEMCEPIN